MAQHQANIRTEVVRHRSRVRRWPLAAVAAVIGLGIVVSPASPAPTAHADPQGGLCSAPGADLRGLQQRVASIKARIAAHNAEGVNRYNAGAVASYNARAGRLNAERDRVNAEVRAALGRVNSCQATANELGKHGPPMNPLTQADRDALDKANKAVPPGWQPPSPLPLSPNRNVAVPRDSPVRPHFDLFEKRKTPPNPYPDIKLQGKPKPKPTDIDPATGRPYGAITSGSRKGQTAVSPDHIVPKSEIVQMPGFTRLTPDQQWAIVNSRLNLHWLGRGVNQRKGSRDVANMKPGLRKEWLEEYKQLQDDKRRILQNMIDRFIASNPK